MTPGDDVQRVAAALARPRAGYVKRLNAARADLAATAGDASRQLGLFLDRVGDLTLEELDELHQETFDRDGARGIAPIVAGLARRPVGPAEAQTAVRALAPVLDDLARDRNPFAYVLRSLCCLLLAPAGSGAEPSPT